MRTQKHTDRHIHTEPIIHWSHQGDKRLTIILIIGILVVPRAKWTYVIMQLAILICHWKQTGSNSPLFRTSVHESPKLKSRRLRSVFRLWSYQQRTVNLSALLLRTNYNVNQRASFQMSTFLTWYSIMFPLPHRRMRISVVCNYGYNSANIAKGVSQHILNKLRPLRNNNCNPLIQKSVYNIRRVWTHDYRITR